MALSTAFEIIKKLNSSMLKAARKEIEKEGYSGYEPFFFINTTAARTIFDVTDRKKLDETLVKVAGDVIQTYVLKRHPLGIAIDFALLKSGNSLGNLLLDAYVGIKNTSFSQGYIYVPNGTGITISGVGPFGTGESYFRVTTITENGRTRIATDTDGHYIGAEVISKSMYESVHPDYNDLRKAKIDILNKIDNITSSFNPDHLVEFENGVLKVTFPDGHIEAEDLEGGNNDITGGDKNDTLVGNAGSDTLQGGKGYDTLHGGADNDVLVGGSDTDYLYGDTGADTILGGDDNASDILIGGSGKDVLMGQGGDDVLVGGNSLEDMYSEKVSDYLSGGSGYNTYYVSHQDIIDDADGSGLIMFNDKATSGKKTKVDEYTYEDDNFTYTIDGANLIVVDKMLGEYITILNFKDGALGIGLETDGDDKKAIELFVGDATTTEGGDLTFTVAITDTLKYDLTVDVGSYFNGSADASDLEGAISGTVVIKAGESSADFTIKSKTDDIDEGVENFIFAATGYSYAGESEDDNDLGSLLIKNKNEGKGTIVDDFFNHEVINNFGFICKEVA